MSRGSTPDNNFRNERRTRVGGGGEAAPVVFDGDTFSRTAGDSK